MLQPQFLQRARLHNRDRTGDWKRTPCSTLQIIYCCSCTDHAASLRIPRWWGTRGLDLHIGFRDQVMVSKNLGQSSSLLLSHFETHPLEISRLEPQDIRKTLTRRPSDREYVATGGTGGLKHSSRSKMNKGYFALKFQLEPIISRLSSSLY